MLLFYSEYCQHCKILLDTIKRHDTNNIVKLVNIDVLRSLKKPIDPKLHSVPALLLSNTKEFLFGKAVFDYLLLPSRGVLFSGQTTRDDKRTSRNNDDINNDNTNSNDISTEPMAFTLGAISAEQFASISEDNNENNIFISDKNYKWDRIDNNLQISNPNQEIIETNKEDKKNKLPSIEDIMKQRAIDVV